MPVLWESRRPVAASGQIPPSNRYLITLVVRMVEVMPRKKSLGPDLPSGQRSQHQGGYGRSFIAGRFRLQVILHRRRDTLESLVLSNVHKSAEVRTDGWMGYDILYEQGYQHLAVLIRGDQAKTDKHLPVVYIVFGNIDVWLLGTYHGVSSVRLQGYLKEFVFRFNRRFYPMVGFESVLKIVVQAVSPTDRNFYENSRTQTDSLI